MKPLRFVLFLCLLLLFSFTTWAQDNPRVLRAAIDQEPTSLNRYYTIQAAAFMFIDLFALPPWLVDDQLQHQPTLVDALPPNVEGGVIQTDDGKTVVRYTLADWAVWSDGTPLTAADFILPFEAANDGVSKMVATLFADVESVEQGATEKEVVVTFKGPHPDWFDAGWSPLPNHLLREPYTAGVVAGTGMETLEFNRNPTLSNGPFIFAEWQTGSFIRFVRNDNFHQPPWFDELVVSYYPDANVMKTIIANGEADIAHNFAPSDVIDFVDDPNFVVDPKFNSGREAWWFNLGDKAHPALRDARVRKAIAMGLDRQVIVDELLAGLTEVPESFWDQTPYFNANIPVISYDPEGALALLNEAGWRDDDGNGICEAHGVEGVEDGTPLRLTHGTVNSPERVDTQVIAQEMLREICIDLEIRAYDIGIFSASYNDGGILRIGENDILMFYGFTVYEGISAVEWFACDNLPSDQNPNGFNAVQKCWPELDTLWDTLNTEVDPTARQQAANDIQQFMADEAFWIGMWNRPQIAVYRSDLQNVRLAGQSQYWQVSEWRRAE